MNGKLKKFLLVFTAMGLLFGVSRLQKSLNRDRDKLGLTRVQPLGRPHGALERREGLPGRSPA